ncbi:importin alpha [Anaeramoeba flamelloides]|uniref:Importin subunit alpha n=1 Tax=Anaeramoeba flamelloides TaxID=1746091 RepID=A0ABQ8X0L2_9EUKA|nr:importin alpha [Anaeramoeba flamelloides]
MSSLFQKRLEKRKKEFKKLSNVENSRNKRYKMQVQLSKNKREQTIMKKRKMYQDIDNTISLNNEELELEKKISMLPTFVQQMEDSNRETKMSSILEIIKMLTVEDYPPIRQIIKSGAIPKLINFLQNSDDLEIQFNSAWALTNLATGNTTDTTNLVKHGIIPVLVDLVESKSEKIVLQAVWALGNIAADSIEHRDLVLKTRTIQQLSNIIKKSENIELLRKTNWTLSTLVQGDELPQWELIKDILPIFYNFLYTEDIELIKDSCIALGFFTMIKKPETLKIITLKFCKHLVELLEMQNVLLIHPILRIFGNIVAGSNKETQYVLDSGVLPIMKEFLEKRPRIIRQEICWALSNICAGTTEQKSAIIHANFIPILIGVSQNDCLRVRYEAAWVLINLCITGKSEQITYMVLCKVLTAFKECLKDFYDINIIYKIFLAIESVLQTGYLEGQKCRKQNNLYARDFEEIGGIKVLESFFENKNDKVSRIVNEIYKKYFSKREEEEEESLDFFNWPSDQWGSDERKEPRVIYEGEGRIKILLYRNKEEELPMELEK